MAQTAERTLQQWVWVRIFIYFTFFIQGALEQVFLPCGTAGRKGQSTFGCPSPPKDTAVPLALPHHQVLLPPAHPATRNYWVCSQVALNTWSVPGNACSAISLTQTITTQGWLRVDFHPYSFVGTCVAKWHWAEKSIKLNVFVIHLAEVLMSSLALICAN